MAAPYAPVALSRARSRGKRISVAFIMVPQGMDSNDYACHSDIVGRQSSTAPNSFDMCHGEWQTTVRCLIVASLGHSGSHVDPYSFQSDLSCWSRSIWYNVRQTTTSMCAEYRVLGLSLREIHVASQAYTHVHRAWPEVISIDLPRRTARIQHAFRAPPLQGTIVNYVVVRRKQGIAIT